MAGMGLDVEEVSTLATSLRANAGELTNIIHKVDLLVKEFGIVWEGPDSAEIVEETWPEVRRGLADVSARVDWLGQAALRNVAEQQEASGVRTPKAGAAGAPGVSGAPGA